VHLYRSCATAKGYGSDLAMGSIWLVVGDSVTLVCMSGTFMCSWGVWTRCMLAMHAAAHLFCRVWCRVSCCWCRKPSAFGQVLVISTLCSQWVSTGMRYFLVV
jgi:hypothetical protein